MAAMTRDYQQEMVDGILAALERRVAPWQQPWDAGSVPSLPLNPTTGRHYQGGNVLWLMVQATNHGYSDPRWCTYKQAQEHGWQVKRSMHGTPITYWKRNELIKEKDPQTGEERRVEVPLERPRPFHAVVFNAEQITGIPELTIERDIGWDPHERAENIISGSGACILHDGGNRAYYRLATDDIHLPVKTAFLGASAYYDTALHELGHWTGHPTRLDRNLVSGRFGDQAYAREELRAELASFFLSMRIDLPHNTEEHASYMSSWYGILKADKYELFRASRDAEKITDYLLARELHRAHQAQQADRTEPDGPAQELVPSGQTGPQPVRYYEPPQQDLEQEWGYDR